jgi:2-polyprenyl-3-methyl-5-hydroxy-6-metoxy-1,4-benzoquinol methylase
VSDDHAQSTSDPGPTADADYTERLVRLSSPLWKRVLPVQAPYRWNIRRLHLGRTLDVGCGVGRNLAFLDRTSVGVDHNVHSVEVARSKGLIAYSADAFLTSPDAVSGSFDTILLAHVVEHMVRETALTIIEGYRQYVKDGGRLVLITPQEAGFRSDSTHVRFVDFEGLRDVADATGFKVDRAYSFPFPRFAGRTFTYNEFVMVARMGRRSV